MGFAHTRSLRAGPGPELRSGYARSPLNHLLQHAMFRESQRPTEVVTEAALAKANEALSKNAISMEPFTKLYGEAAVTADKAEVQRLEKLYEEEDTPQQRRGRAYTTIFEGLWHDQAGKGWLGPEATAFRPTRFDDIKNGVDSIVEFRKSNNEASHLAFAIDVTYSTDIGVKKKVERIGWEIRHGRMAEVKYFNSEALGFMGLLKNVPRVVIGVEKRHIDRMAQLWIDGKDQELAEDPVQVVVLEQIKMQLAAYRALAERKNQKQLIPFYDRMAATVETLLSQKADLRQKKAKEISDLQNGDRVNLALKHYLALLR